VAGGAESGVLLLAVEEPVVGNAGAVVYVVAGSAGHHVASAVASGVIQNLGDGNRGGSASKQSGFVSDFTLNVSSVVPQEADRMVVGQVSILADADFLERVAFNQQSVARLAVVSVDSNHTVMAAHAETGGAGHGVSDLASEGKGVGAVRSEVAILGYSAAPQGHVISISVFNSMVRSMAVSTNAAVLINMTTVNASVQTHVVFGAYDTSSRLRASHCDSCCAHGHNYGTKTGNEKILSHLFLPSFDLIGFTNFWVNKPLFRWLFSTLTFS